MIEAPLGTTTLPLADDTASCACCAVPDAAAEGATSAAGSSSVVAEYRVTGMTCGNCVAHVAADVGAIPGVADVRVELVAGGVSTVTVVSASPIDPALVAEAVDEAGYAVAG